MRSGLKLVCILCCWVGLREGTATAQPTQVQGCATAVLDVSTLPVPPSFSYGVHMFAIELQNIGPVSCSIQSPQVVLEPVADTNNQPFYAAVRTEDPEHETHPLLLAPGAWAHVVLVWTSHAAPELSCDQYSTVRLGFTYQWQQLQQPGVEIRHLWIRACGPFGVSGYRAGRYSIASPIPKTWLDWFGATGSPNLAIARPTPSNDIAASSPLMTLIAQSKRTMLGDLGFSLRLDFPRLAANGCAFSQMRKRESNGATFISLQQCDEVPQDKSAVALPVPRYHDPGVIGLAMGNLDFLPKRPGPLQFEIIAPVGRVNGGTAYQYARTQVDLIARDPVLPRQVAILDPLPPCTPYQLSVVSFPPVAVTPLKTLRSYNATNISTRPCSLAGVPRTRGLDAKGNYEPFLVPPCPNCENDLFLPRPNGRIDLEPGESAHLLAAGVGKAAGYCGSSAKFELSLNRDSTELRSLSTGPQPDDIAQSLIVPFDARDCVAVDVSAWRQGVYDGDPLNLHQAKTAAATQPSPVPTDCAKPELLAHGQPHMIEGAHDPDYGLSMEQQGFIRDQQVPLYVWTHNSSDRPVEIGSCSDPAYLKAGGFVLYDAYGHRMLNKRQLEIAKVCEADPAHASELLICNDSFYYPLSPHACTNSRVDLERDYELPPGEYTISTRDPGDVGACPHRREKPYQRDAARDIVFTIVQP